MYEEGENINYIWERLRVRYCYIEVMMLFLILEFYLDSYYCREIEC